MTTLDARPASRCVDKAHITDELARARARTLALLDCVAEETQVAQHSELMSPMVWDLAHIGNYEEQWLVRALGGSTASDPGLDEIYDAFAHPRATRAGLPMMGPGDARAYIADVRTSALRILRDQDLGATRDDNPDGDDDPRRRTNDTTSEALVAEGFVYGMVIQHEHQHDETLLAAHQLLLDRAETPPGAVRTTPMAGIDVGAIPEMCIIEGGACVVGTEHWPWAYDNELPAHDVALQPFAIDTTPVTNRAFRAFIVDGGYDDEDLWDPEGWDWLLDTDIEAPMFWQREGPRTWSLLRFGERLDLADVIEEPVQHVSWYEADAFARWAEKRLPTEAEWEAAAGSPARFPWGDATPSEERANLSQRHAGPAVAGAYPEGASPYGVLGMIGDVWEWTSSDFQPHPGFIAFPYREYSEVFWGSAYKVLKGGSWATDHTAIRVGFRNWDFPIRRQIFAGFRCAKDL